MFNRLKKIFQKEDAPVKKKPIIITIHGFGRRRQHEFDNLILWGKEDGYAFVQFDIYDLFDEKDCDWMLWIQRCKRIMDHFVHENREIILVGFSMGGVIASYLSTIYPVKKLILLAPAFNYIHMDMVTNAITKSAKKIMGITTDDEIKLPSTFYNAFTEIVHNLKKYIEKVQCPTLIIHGDEDEIISLKSSLSIIEKIPHDQKKLYIMHQGSHRLLMDQQVAWDTYQVIRLFLDDQIIVKQPKSYAKDILDDLLIEKRKREEENK